MDRPALQLDRVAIMRGGRLLLRDVSFSAAPGEFLALRGPNGAGKTSLLRALAGLAPIASGALRAGDVSRGEDPEGYREQILFGGHQDAVKPSLTVRENLAFWTRFYGGGAESDARAAAALERFGLAALAEAPAGHCSAGQKRRLGLARLAAARRPVWLLDEPTVSLDAASVAALTALIQSHCAAGGAVVAATHQEFPINDLRSVDVSAFAPKKDDAADLDADPFLTGFDDEGGR